MDRNKSVEEVAEMEARAKAEMEEAGVPTEEEMAETKAPTPGSIEELGEYVQGLVDRPHSYGTCVYAMSLAAVAAFNYVARELGVTGFQASCADLDILRQTRGWTWGKVLDYNKLLYPQYLNHENFPSVSYLLEEHRVELGRRAQEILDEGRELSPGVEAHLRGLVFRGGEAEE